MNLIGLLMLSLAAATFFSGGAESAKILGVWILPGRSHYVLGSSLMKGLAEAGHNVTLVCPFEDDEPPSHGRYRNIVLHKIIETHEKVRDRINFFQMQDVDSIFSQLFLTKIVQLYVDLALDDPQVQKLMKEKSFDVVILEQFNNDALKGLAPHFNAHLILFSSFFASSWVNDITGNPSPTAYIPEIETSFSAEMNFWQRTHNTLIWFCRKLIFYGYNLPQAEKQRQKYFSANSPTLYDMYVNSSLVFLNSHDSYNQPVPLVPNMIPIGGYHIKPPKKLTSDIQKILDDAPEGVVYFSMGSTMKSSQLPDSKRNIIMAALGKLKQKVLWKWETDDLPGKPKNVVIRKWWPQSDILAHKNIKLFVTHGGILSTSEAVYHGVPVLGIPVFGDQIINSKAAENNGYALRLNYHDPDWSEERFSRLLDQLLNDPKYRENAKQRSKLFHDRPMKPMDAIVYWVEYVLRTNGAHHLKVLGRTLPWYQYYLVDVVLFLVGASIAITVLFVLVLRTILKTLRCQSTKKQKKS